MNQEIYTRPLGKICHKSRPIRLVLDMDKDILMCQGKVLGHKSLTARTPGGDQDMDMEINECGPAADDTAAAFRAFWSEKSELRRFKDGAVIEAVMWPNQTGNRFY